MDKVDRSTRIISHYPLLERNFQDEAWIGLSFKNPPSERIYRYDAEAALVLIVIFREDRNYHYLLESSLILYMLDGARLTAGTWTTKY